MRILVTGAAGFIGAAVSEALVGRGDEVIGLDNLNNYYDVGLKQARLARLTGVSAFRFLRADIADRRAMEALGMNDRFDAIVHLAAQAGVRYSVSNPNAYLDSNLLGFGHVLELARASGAGHLVFASSSSVYVANAKLPFSEHDNVDHPVSLYAATKKANEVMAHAYAWVHGLRCTGLRFFTVYGPWGRPDMSPIVFARGIVRGEPIRVFNSGDMMRDFTYIDDVVQSVLRVIDRPPAAGAPEALRSPATSTAPFRLYNVGNSKPIHLRDYIALYERLLGRKAVLEYVPLQAGDVIATAADTADLETLTGLKPATPIEEGVRRFVDWYRSYYGEATLS
jgi:UDP-glucuronate 4-epimerase